MVGTAGLELSVYGPYFIEQSVPQMVGAVHLPLQIRQGLNPSGGQNPALCALGVDLGCLGLSVGDNGHDLVL